MYTPKFYKVTDVHEIQEFVSQHSFGTIVTTDDGRPIATHLPLPFYKQTDECYITGHMAVGNPQWRTFAAGKDVLVIYQGPHAYISSSWYEHENVPTWNYQAVHVYGEASLLEGEELQQDLARLLEKYESHRENPILWDTLSSPLLEKEMKGIVGFKIRVKEIQAAYKLSQNRNPVDYLNIIKHLQQEENPLSAQVADAMKKRIRE